MSNSYSVRFLPKAYNDLESIYRYINEELKNIPAVNNLAEKFEKAFIQISDFPFSCPLCKTESEYRKTVIENYIIFYKVFENTKTVIVFRILYGMMDYEKYL